MLCYAGLIYLYRGNKQAAIEKFTKAHDIYMKVNPTNSHAHTKQMYLPVTAECKERGECAKKMGESDNNLSSTKSRKLSQ